jgi:hypothetical protein
MLSFEDDRELPEPVQYLSDASLKKGATSETIVSSGHRRWSEGRERRT